MRQPRHAHLLLALSVIAFLAGIVWISLATTPPDETSVGTRPVATASASASAPASASVVPPLAAQAPLHDARGLGIVQPRRVVIPAIDVDTTVVPVGLDASNGVAVPDDIRIVGWWKFGVAPGAARGSAVLVAHRDGVAQGQGVFYALGALDVGDRVIVTDRAGRPLEYRVAAREYIRRQALPLAELFAVDGPPRLTLISCGGPYIKSQGGYQDNIVVTAVPA